MSPKELTVSRKDLARALKLSQKTYLSPGYCEKWSIPFSHSCIVFTADPRTGVLSMCTSTRDMAVRVSISMSEYEGLTETLMFAVMAQDILPVFRRLEGEDIQFRIHEHRLEVLHSFGSFSVPLVEEGLDYFNEKLSGLQERDTPIHLETEAASLRSVLNRCAYAMAHDSLRPVLNSISVSTGGDMVDFVASDGHKLVRIQKPVPGAPTSRIVIPEHAVKVLRHILPKGGSIDISYSTAPEDTEKENKAGCYVGVLNEGIDFWFIPADGKFPDYTKVIPKELDSVATVERNTLLKSLDRLHFFTPRDYSIISIKESGLHIKVSDKDFLTEAEERIPATLQGKPLTFGMNMKFLKETLRNIHSGNIQIAGHGLINPFIVRPENQSETETVTMLVMPLHVNDE